MQQGIGVLQSIARKDGLVSSSMSGFDLAVQLLDRVLGVLKPGFYVLERIGLVFEMVMSLGLAPQVREPVIGIAFNCSYESILAGESISVP